MMVFAAAFQAACALTALAPVEEDTFLVDGIPMSNFLHPSWFEPFKHPPGTKFDLLGLLTKPFSMTKGARIGKAKAVTATARKIAVLFYNAVRYVDPGASFYETRYRARVIDNLHRRAKVFGFALHPLGPTPPAPVS